MQFFELSVFEVNPHKIEAPPNNIGWEIDGNGNNEDWQQTEMLLLVTYCYKNGLIVKDSGSSSFKMNLYGIKI